MTPDQATNPTHASWHRLAPTASGDRGNTGNHGVDLMRQAEALLIEARTLQMPTARLTGKADDLAWIAAQELCRERLVKAWELVELAHRLMERSTGTAILQRRLDRLQGVNDRRLDRERRRAEGGLYAGEGRSANIPTHVEATDEAWRAIKKDVAGCQWATLGGTVGGLVTAAPTATTETCGPRSLRHGQLPCLRLGAELASSSAFSASSLSNGGASAPQLLTRTSLLRKRLSGSARDSCRWGA